MWELSAGWPKAEKEGSTSQDLIPCNFFLLRPQEASLGILGCTGYRIALDG